MKFKAVIIVFILFLVSAVSASAATYNIQVTGAGDGYYHNESGRSYDFFEGSSGNISAHYQFWGYSDDLGTNTGYAQFSMASAPDVADIVSVTLNLNMIGSYLTAPTPNAGSILHRSDASSANGSASQRLGGNELVTTVGTGLSGWQSFDVTDYVKNDITNAYNWSVFSFAANADGDYSNRYAGFSFSSAEAGLPAYLSITTAEAAVPAPSSLLLLGFSLLGLAGIGRKL